MSDQKVPSTFEIAKTGISLALTKLGIAYQAALQAAEDVPFSKDDLPGGQLKLDEIKKFKKAIDDLKNPYTPAWKAWNDAKASLFDPAEEVLTRKAKEFKDLNDEVKAEKKKLDDEEARKTNIKTAITNFTLEYSTKIAAATTNDELVALQKRIGAEKSRSGFYQELLPDLTKAVEGLETALKTQKEHVGQLETLKVQQTAAEMAGDDEKVVELLEKQDEIVAKIDDTKAAVQEEAINRSTAFVAPEPAHVVAPVAAKAKKTIWAWEIVDMEVFAKKHPDMVKTVADKEKIDDRIRELKGAKTIKEGTFSGLKIYQKEYL